MSAISRIYNLQDKDKAKAKVVGGGVLVADSYVLTCAHVVAKALRVSPYVSETPRGAIDIDFPLAEAGHKLKATVQFWRPVQPTSASRQMEGEDIAIVKLEGELPKGVKPTKLVSSGEFSEDPFRILGFPLGHEDGVWATGILSGPLAQRWMQVEDTKLPGYRVEAGFSGAPVWDKKLAGVVGITVAAETEVEKKTAFIIPTEVLTKVIPEDFLYLPKDSSSSPTVDEKYLPIINAFTVGKIVPFFGAGIHLCDYPSASPIEQALQLARQYNQEGHLLGIPCSICPLPVQCWPPPEDCPILRKLRESDSDDISTCSLSNEQKLILSKMNLRFLAQYIRLLHESDNALYKELHRIWNRQYTEFFEGNKNLHRVHEFFATLPKTMLRTREQREFPYPLIVTTTRDEMLENAFKEAGQEFDVVFYTTEDQGQFIHRPWQGRDNPIPYNTDYELPFGNRPIILKLYGTWNEKFVITEDHYLNYLVGCSIEQALPAKLVNTVKNSRVLFLGYSLNDPDLKIVLNRFWGDQPLKKKCGMKSWIIHQSEPGRLEEEFWKERQVDPIKSSLEEFVTNLEVGIEQINL